MKVKDLIKQFEEIDNIRIFRENGDGDRGYSHNVNEKALECDVVSFKEIREKQSQVLMETIIKSPVKLTLGIKIREEEFEAAYGKEED